MSRHQGQIDRWNDHKGFGFICPDNGGERLFFHISALTGPRPSKGQRVEFVPSYDSQGRPRAEQVRVISAKPAAHKTFKASRTPQWLALGLIILALALWQIFSTGSPPQVASQYSPQLEHTLQLIRQGGPYPYQQDNTVFHNRERLLPPKPRGYYREYTVDTPGLSHRGARRVVTGGHPPEVWYYTEDHYRSFIRLEPKP